MYCAPTHLQKRVSMNAIGGFNFLSPPYKNLDEVEAGCLNEFGTRPASTNFLQRAVIALDDAIVGIICLPGIAGLTGICRSSHRRLQLSGHLLQLA